MEVVPFFFFAGREGTDMNLGVDFTASLVADGFGALLMLVTLIGNRWRLHEKNTENNIVMLMVVLTLFTCVVDFVSAAVDGQPGELCRVAAYASALWLFVGALLICSGWIVFISSHLRISLSRWHRRLLIGLMGLNLLLLIVNFFVPVVFTVNESNVYIRHDGYIPIFVTQFFFLCDGLLLYLRARRQGGLLKFFPVWVFVIPAMAGALAQSFLYGVSTLWPGIAITVSTIVASLQNELIFRDKLTGLYNRFHLDNLKTEIARSRQGSYTAMMLDLNDFKSINDQLGHSVGDEALVATGKILVDAVGGLGNVIRYAGDEFVIVLNTQDEQKVRACEDAIRQGVRAFNESGKAPYRLSVSIGTCPMDLRVQSVDDLMNEVDRRMFVEKRAYYAGHPGGRHSDR